MSDFNLSAYNDDNESQAPQTPTDDENTRPWWDTEDALEALKLEKSFKPELSDAALAKEILLQASPQAATSIIQIALHARNDAARLSAAKYIMDYVKEELSVGSGAKASWENLIGSALSEVELYANTSQPTATSLSTEAIITNETETGTE